MNKLKIEQIINSANGIIGTAVLCDFNEKFYLVHRAYIEDLKGLLCDKEEGKNEK